MKSSTILTTGRILGAFSEGIAGRGGRVTDSFDDGRRLFARSVLPREEEVRPKDRVQGGVALKATAEGVWLLPYVFRQVCRNGAIMAKTVASRSLGALQELESETAIERIHEGIVACSAPQVFLDNVRRMRTAGEVRADLALNMLPMLSQLSKSVGAEVLSHILDLFFRDGDQSQFGLANAVTAVARETRDPDVRWNLEEFGGGVCARAIPRHPADRGGAAAARRDLAVAVG